VTFDPPPSGLGINKKSLDYAVEFLHEEFSSHREIVIAPARTLLESMVRTVGTDLGVLSFEVDKAVTLAITEGKNSIDPSHIKRVVRPSNHFDMTTIRESLAKRKVKPLLESLNRAYKYSVSDPTMMFLRGKGGPGDLAMVWLQSSLCIDKGGNADRIADLTGSPVWAVARDTIPAIRLWGTDNLKFLVMSLAEVDRGYILGAPSPRTALESALVRSISR
jgi:DNA polymerase III delta subunit